MSNIPPNSIGNFNGPAQDYILKRFKKLGSLSDLYILRQVNEEYYQALNSTFLDFVKKGIQIVETELPEDDEIQKMMMNSKLTSNDDDTDDEDLLYCTVNRHNWHRTIVRTNDGETLDVDKLDPQTAHIFRKLEFKKVWIGKLKMVNIPLYEIVTQLAPYITSLRLNTLPLNSKSKNPGRKYSEFLNGLTNLKNLELDIISKPLGYYKTVKPMSMKSLRIGVANLQLKPKITFYAKENYKQILAKFGETENVSFNLHFVLRDNFPWMTQNYNTVEIKIAKMKSILAQFGSQKNIKYKLEFGPFQNLTQIETITEICVKLQMNNQLGELDLFFYFDQGTFIQEDRLGIVNCLTKLSPLTTRALFDFRRSSPTSTWDILNHDLEWPKLTILWIFAYNYPLEILKKCTNLNTLYLDVDQDACIFHNLQQSEKDSLKEYFGKLLRFKKLRILTPPVVLEQKLAYGNDLDGYLKEILPQIKYTYYYNWEHFVFKDEEEDEDD